jgi:hypothetical protein
MTPLGVATALWVIWALSWLVAAIWSSRPHSRAGLISQLPYRLITTAGFVLLFGFGRPDRHFVSLPQWVGVDLDGSYCCRIWVGLVGTTPFGEALVRLCHAKRRTPRHRNRPVRDRPPSHLHGVILAAVTIAILKGNLSHLSAHFLLS